MAGCLLRLENTEANLTFLAPEIFCYVIYETLKSHIIKLRQFIDVFFQVVLCVG